MPLRPPTADPLEQWANVWRQAADTVSAGGDKVAEWLRDTGDIAGNIRYGMPTSEKERLASSGSLPGAPVDPSEDQDVANRYAAGYLFGQQYPNAAPVIQPYVDQIKTSGIPFLGGESPELQSYARHGVSVGSGSLGDLMTQYPPAKR